MKIVVGYVISDEGRAALEWAIDDSRRHGSHIVVVHSIRGGGSLEAEEEECWPTVRSWMPSSAGLLRKVSPILCAG